MDVAKSVARLNPLTVIVLICLSLTLIPIFYQGEGGGLKLPQCQEEEIVETIIDFFVYKSIWSAYGEDRITENINSAINKANHVLKNSCIPMRRRLGEIYQVNIKSKPSSKLNVDRYHKKLFYEVEPAIIEYIHTHPNHYYALVVDDLPKRIQGATNPFNYSQFLILSIRADHFTLEHELGHLAYAWHDDNSWGSKLTDRLEQQTPEENKDQLHPYARGYHCGGHRTIMSVQKHSFNYQLPVYSSPDIFFGNQACGDQEDGNNARQLREYAYQLREKLVSH